MFRQVFAFVLILAIGNSASPPAAGAVDSPSYSIGDFWAYATNLTQELGISFEGSTRIEVVRFGALPIQGSNNTIAELLVRGGGFFSGAFTGFGDVVGTWTITGTEAWKTDNWRSLRSFFRITAEGDLKAGPTSLPFTLSVTNETTRRTVSDTWPWPITEGAEGHWLAHWVAHQNISFELTGGTSGWNDSSFESDYSIRFTHVRTERVSVPAGQFGVHVIREEGPGGLSRIRWYAPSVGNDVRQEEFNETGDLVASAELLDYSYGGAAHQPISWLTALNGILLATTTGLVVAVAIRHRRKSADLSSLSSRRMKERPLP